MITINQLLTDATAAGASDMHLTVGVPPKVRVSGLLQSLDYPPLMPDDLHELGYSILPENLTLKYEENGEVDFSYSIKGVGRYRVNLYHQRSSLAARPSDLLQRIFLMRIPWEFHSRYRSLLRRKGDLFL